MCVDVINPRERGILMMWIKRGINVGVKSLNRQVGMASGAQRRGLSLNRSMDGSPVLGTWKVHEHRCRWVGRPWWSLWN